MTFQTMCSGCLLVLSLAAAGVGCAAPTDAPGAGETDDQVVTRRETTAARFAGLEARVNKDFAGVASLRGQELVFILHKDKSNATKTFIQGRIIKWAKSVGRELEDVDFKGSAYEAAIADGVFDGPELSAVLERKADGTWEIMKNGDQEAYVVGPTDTPFEAWDREFGIPHEWLTSP